MACKFCPKIRKTDWIFIFIAAIGFYIADKLEEKPILTTQKSVANTFKPLSKNATEKERKERFEKLQKACLFEKDKQACKEVF
ncbi:hypothetical protein [Helicobacter cetorum]|uniref:hypothetical protein n=1 Tax=Helicobacter cetorum TaxID=138563 RepID=UPI000CF0BBF5|nr:hypothetical protein [Helicobacter cetorum]